MSILNKFSFITAFLLLFISTSSFALKTICSPPVCKVYSITSSDGVVVNVNDWGAYNPNRPAILFLHGSPNDGMSWLYQFNSVLNLKYRLITMDWRPLGLTSKPENPLSYTPGLAADDVLAVLHNLHVKDVVLVGHSAGGVVLESYLNTYGTQHDGIKVKGVVFVSALADLVGFQYVTPTSFTFTLAALNATTADEFIAANQGFLNLAFAHPIDPGLKSFLLTRMLISPKAPRQALLTAFLTPGVFNLNLTSATVKTLIIWGASDAIVSLDGGTYLHNNIPGSQLVVLPDTGHSPMIEKPVQFNLLLDKFARSVF